MSRRRTVVDNVIYANFGREPQISHDRATQRKARKDTRSFAARILLESLAAHTDAGRLSRGRTYARKGHVVELHFLKGRVEARVAGSQNVPFTVVLSLPHRSADDITAVLKTISELPHGMKFAGSGKLPDEIVRALIAERSEEVMVSCDCPDYSPVCKHAIAVAAVVAEQIEAVPERIFALRGVNLERLHEMLTRVASGVAQGNSMDPELFWRGRELPDLPEPEVIPVILDSDLDALHKAIRCVSYTSVDELRGVADIEDLYDFLIRD